MAYMALYRKWRPNNFDEIQGQDAIVQTLRNQILYDRIGHAYLFCGTRGTGKTSVAKVFAKAVNCAHPINGNPCNDCPTCRAINSQNSFDVLEIDAASNNGVDHIREIRDQVKYPPAAGKYKVYIIDEVHMLSAGAFNALLKTLEEPPSYVIFILATTEKHAIPVTILSRCQKYDFKRISVDTIAAHLTSLMEQEKISAEEKAIRYIARVADGSMRDALSLLDQCISFYLNQTLTYENVLEVLGTVDTAVFSRLLYAVLERNTGAVLDTIDQLMTEGRELSQFLSDFLWYLRNLLVLKDQNSMVNSLDLSAESIETLKEDAGRIETGTLLRYIRVLSELSGQMRTTSQKRVLMEVGFIRLCTPQMETDTDSLLERLNMLEAKLSENTAVVAAMPGIDGQNDITKGTEPVNPPDSQTLLEQRFSPAEVEDLKKIAARWEHFTDQLSPLTKMQLQNARIIVDKDSTRLKLILRNNEMSLPDLFKGTDNKRLEELSNIIAKETGKLVTFECVAASSAPEQNSDSIDLSAIHFPINRED